MRQLTGARHNSILPDAEEERAKQQRLEVLGANFRHVELDAGWDISRHCCICSALSFHGVAFTADPNSFLAVCRDCDGWDAASLHYVEQLSGPALRTAYADRRARTSG